MKVEVVKGSVIYKDKEYQIGTSFQCEKEVAESLIKGNVVAVVKTTESTTKEKKED